MMVTDQSKISKKVDMMDSRIIEIQKQRHSFSPVHRLFERQLGGIYVPYHPKTWPDSLIDSHLENTKKFHYKDLLGHHGCVNSIEFSSDGQFLISGGDDRRVLLWNVWETIIVADYKPKRMRKEHDSNIFCLSFDQQMEKVFSGGNDELVIVHDVKTCEEINVFLHMEDVYGISVDPTNSNIFASASNELTLWDIRDEDFSLRWNTNGGVFHSVMHNPRQTNLIIVSSSKNGIEMFDVRQLSAKLRGFYPSDLIVDPPSAMCARFDSTGNKILGLGRKSPPALYDIRCPYPQLLFDGDGFFNSCTLKNCSFAGQNNQFAMSGSDNFFVYLWKIPDEIMNETVMNRDSINYVIKPTQILSGHRSIVNQVRYNNLNGIIASAGVEKIIKLWSPLLELEKDHSIDSHSSKFERRFYKYGDFISSDLGSQTENSVAEDIRLISYFDSMMEREISFSSFSSFSSSDDDFESYFRSPKSNHFIPAKLLQQYKYLLPAEMSSNAEEKYVIQNRFNVSSKKPMLDHFDHLDLVYAKRMHTRYLTSFVDYISARINLMLSKLMRIMREGKKKIKNPKPHVFLMLLYKARRHKLTAYKDFYDKIQLKKKATLLTKAYKLVAKIYIEFRRGSLFEVDKINENYRLSLKKVINFFEKPEKIDLLARRMAMIPDKKLFDRKLYSLIICLLEKAHNLAKILFKSLNMCTTLKTKNHIFPFKKKSFIAYYHSRRYLAQSSLLRESSSSSSVFSDDSDPVSQDLINDSNSNRDDSSETKDMETSLSSSTTSEDDTSSSESQSEEKFRVKTGLNKYRLHDFLKKNVYNRNDDESSNSSIWDETESENNNDEDDNSNNNQSTKNMPSTSSSSSMSKRIEKKKCVRKRRNNSRKSSSDSKKQRKNEVV